MKNDTASKSTNLEYPLSICSDETVLLLMFLENTKELRGSFEQTTSKWNRVDNHLYDTAWQSQEENI